MKNHIRSKSATLSTTIALAMCMLILPGQALANENPGYTIPSPEAPKSFGERLGELEARHNSAFASFSANLNRIPNEQGLLGSKALFEMVDESTREMRNIRSANNTLINAVRGEVRTVRGGSAYSEAEKEDLLGAAEALEAKCRELNAKLDHSISRLGAAYTIFPRWNRVYRSYRNLQGEAKAREVVKSHIEEYLSSFTPEPPATDEALTADEAQDAFGG